VINLINEMVEEILDGWSVGIGFAFVVGGFGMGGGFGGAEGSGGSKD